MHKFISIFSSVIRPLVSEEKDQYLALASLIDVGNFIPNIDIEKNTDLLPIAFNACVVNRANKNGDVIDTETALAVYKNFINKPINIEHNRQNIIGTILTAGFSEFGTDLPLKEEDVKVLKGPFNIVLGGIMWKIANSNLAEVIENSNDPTSEDYLSVSASWELGFTDYHLILTEADEKNIENGQIVEDKEEIAKLSEFLKGFGGFGKMENGKNIYRKVINQVVPLGIGLTANPAADVKGVAVKINLPKEEKLNKEENNSSLSQDINVIKIKENMKISSLTDITDLFLKEVSASAVVEFIEDELKKASEKFTSEKVEVQNALKTASEKNEILSQEQEALKQELLIVKKSLEEVEKAKAAQESENLFNQRMAALEEEFQFDDELRAEIAKEIKDLNEESFSAYRSKMKKMAKGLTKKQEKLPSFIKDKLIEKEKKEGKTGEDKEDCKEAKSSEEIAQEVVDKAKDIKEAVLASTTPGELSVAEKYRKAFLIENFNIKY